VFSAFTSRSSLRSRSISSRSPWLGCVPP
jgi:hypothetical protein